jgi:hypothetical protein
MPGVRLPRCEEFADATGPALTERITTRPVALQDHVPSPANEDMRSRVRHPPPAAARKQMRPRSETKSKADPAFGGPKSGPPPDIARVLQFRHGGR